MEPIRIACYWAVRAVLTVVALAWFCFFAATLVVGGLLQGIVDFLTPRGEKYQ